MTQLLEPHALDMERFFANRQGNISELPLDYSKVPRSSGDGMEFTFSSSSEETSSNEDTEEEHLQRRPDRLSLPDKTQFSTNHVVAPSLGNRAIVQEKHSTDPCVLQSQTERTLSSTTTSIKHDKQMKLRNQTVYSGATENTLSDAHVIDHQNSVNLLLQGAELSELNSHVRLPFIGENKELICLAQPASDAAIVESLMRTSIVEQDATFVDSRTVINDLEEQNSKLVQEKTKLTVQLGVQTKINAELKKLLVASVGDDVSARLEDLVTKNTQQTVELNHWKKMCEEYSEESDRLEIECDVWRTKFLASRMMSDELCSWKATLYTRFRQAQSALERLLHERSQLQQYLVQTRRIIQSLLSMLKCASSMQPNIAMATLPSVHEQSILEMAAINTSLARETWDAAENVLPRLSLSETSVMLMQGQEAAEGLQMEPTPAEKLAMEVLSGDVDLQAEEGQLSGVMKRMSQQYMGHGYHSRFSTKNFRVTFDCCHRCTGVLHVV